MNEYVTLDGDDLRWLLGLANRAEEIRKVSVAMGGDGLKVKVNEGMWSPSLGRLVETE